MDLFYYVNMIICCFFSGCMCSWRFVYSTSHIEVIHHWLLVGGIQVGSVEVITMCYIFRDSVVCLWWIYEMCSICNSCRWNHRLCLRELFFHGLGSRLGLPRFFGMLCVSILLCTQSLLILLLVHWISPAAIFLHTIGLEQFLVVSLLVFSCLPLIEDSWNDYGVRGKVLSGIVNWNMLKILE